MGMANELEQWIGDSALGGPGYRDWLGRRFNPEAAAWLQGSYDRLCADLARDFAERMVADGLSKTNGPLTDVTTSQD
jgi:hypothetical protein